MRKDSHSTNERREKNKKKKIVLVRKERKVNIRQSFEPQMRLPSTGEKQ